MARCEIEPARLHEILERERTKRTETVIHLMFAAPDERAAPPTAEEPELGDPFGPVKPRVARARWIGALPADAELCARWRQPSRFFGERRRCARCRLQLWPGEILGIAGVDGNGQKHSRRSARGAASRAAHGSISNGNGSRMSRAGACPNDGNGSASVMSPTIGWARARWGHFRWPSNLVLKEIGAAPYWRRGRHRLEPSFTTSTRASRFRPA